MEELEWEFQDENCRENVKLSDKNKTINHIGINSFRESHIKLKNKSGNKDKKYKVTVDLHMAKYTDIQIYRRPDLWIGVCNAEWKNHIYLDYVWGSVVDNNNKMTKKRAIYSNKIQDSITIIDRCIRKSKDATRLYSLSIESNNDGPIFNSIYQDEERKQLMLYTNVNMEFNVEVIGKTTNTKTYSSQQNHISIISKK